jgi:uncharacterized spore protein YtfJ
MDDNLNKAFASAVSNQEQATELMAQLLAVAEPGRVYSEPVVSGDHTVITASEVTAGMGIGFGVGFGSAPSSQEIAADAQAERTPGEGQKNEGSGAGGGGGGGGGAFARPVAVISIGPGGVRVEPVVDVTKVALAFFTAFGSMFLMLSRMRRASRS